LMTKISLSIWRLVLHVGIGVGGASLCFLFARVFSLLLRGFGGSWLVENYIGVSLARLDGANYLIEGVGWVLIELLGSSISLDSVD
jgi:hypothetical protein